MGGRATAAAAAAATATQITCGATTARLSVLCLWRLCVSLRVCMWSANRNIIELLMTGFWCWWLVYVISRSRCRRFGGVLGDIGLCCTRERLEQHVNFLMSLR